MEEPTHTGDSQTDRLQPSIPDRYKKWVIPTKTDDGIYVVTTHLSRRELESGTKLDRGISLQRVFVVVESLVPSGANYSYLVEKRAALKAGLDQVDRDIAAEKGE